MPPNQNKMSEQQEKKNRSIAMAASVGFHGLLLIAFMLMMAWRAPNPPLPEYGIEVNFGMDDQGGGVSVNKVKVSDPNEKPTFTLLQNKYLLAQKGKKNYYLIIVE